MTEPLKHRHLIVRAEMPAPTDPPSVADWLGRLIATLGMKPLCQPIALYHDAPGNRGLTAFAIITTSHCALHTWDEPTPNIVQLDIYSCAEFELADVFALLRQFGEPSKLSYKFIDRDVALEEVASSDAAPVV